MEHRAGLMGIVHGAPAGCEIWDKGMTALEFSEPGWQLSSQTTYKAYLALKKFPGKMSWLFSL